MDTKQENKEHTCSFLDVDIQAQRANLMALKIMNKEELQQLHLS
jgi:hypothetical protein